MGLAAIRSDATIVVRVSRRGAHQTLIDTWRRQAIEGLACVFSGKTETAAAEWKGEVETLSANFGQVVVERDFYAKPPDDARRPKARAAAPCPAGEPAMRAGRRQPLGVLQAGEGREPAHPCAHAVDRRQVPRDVMVRKPADGPPSPAPGSCCRAQARPLADGEDRPHRSYQEPRTAAPHPDPRRAQRRACAPRKSVDQNSPRGHR